MVAHPRTSTSFGETRTSPIVRLSRIVAEARIDEGRAESVRLLFARAEEAGAWAACIVAEGRRRVEVEVAKAKARERERAEAEAGRAKAKEREGVREKEKERTRERERERERQARRESRGERRRSAPLGP